MRVVPYLRQCWLCALVLCAQVLFSPSASLQVSAERSGSGTAAWASSVEQSLLSRDFSEISGSAAAVAVVMPSKPSAQLPLPTEPVGCSSPSFASAVPYTTRAWPVAVAVGDFNRDDIFDLVSANYALNNVAVLLGTGTGTFEPSNSYHAEGYAVSVVVEDFNQDGNPDIAVANQNRSTVAVLPGTGNGSFGGPNLFSVGGVPNANPYSIALGDFNLDGNSDLVTANESSDDVSVLLGTGTGSFAPASHFYIGSYSYPRSVAVGDFNRDGNPDLVVAIRGSDSVAVLTGTGTGSFGAPTLFPVGTSPRFVAVGDFNRDGNSDLAVANFLSDNISVLLGTGTGSFGGPTNIAVGTNPRSVAIGDFSRDGILDLAVANLGSDNISVLLGTGTGIFGGPTNYATGDEPISVAAGDFNRDGKPDLVTADSGTLYVSVLLNTCQEPWATPTNTPIHTRTSTPTNLPTSVSTATPSRTRTTTGTPTHTVTGTTPTGTSIGTPAQATNTVVATATATVTVPSAGTATATREPCTITFTDVPDTNTFYANIRCLSCRGILSGYADGTYRPNNLVTRGQLAKIVSNAAGFAESPDPQMFQDVAPDNTFYQWINRLARRGHMSGYPCGGSGEPCLSGMPYFRPSANATRGQTSKIVSNAAGYSEIAIDQTFEDVPPTHTFYMEIQRLASRGIMGGYPCGGVGEPCLSGKPYFRPANNVTRGQSAKVVANTFFPDCLISDRH